MCFGSAAQLTRARKGTPSPLQDCVTMKSDPNDVKQGKNHVLRNIGEIHLCQRRCEPIRDVCCDTVRVFGKCVEENPLKMIFLNALETFGDESMAMNSEVWASFLRSVGENGRLSKSVEKTERICGQTTLI